MKIRVRRFDPAFLQESITCLLVGKRATGKSTLMKDFLYHTKNVPYGIAVSGSEVVNQFYTGILPPEFVYDEYSPELMQKLIKFQTKRTTEANARRKLREKYKDDPQMLRGNPEIDPRMWLVLDDVLHDVKTFVNDKSAKFLFFNGRHVSISLFVLQQYCVAMPPAFRANLDLVVLFREGALQNRKKLYDLYAGVFPSFAMFEATLKELTRNYGALVINNRATSGELADTVFWYQASHRPDFKGAWYAWEIVQELTRDPSALANSYNDDDDEDDAPPRPAAGPQYRVLRD